MYNKRIIKKAFSMILAVFLAGGTVFASPEEDFAAYFPENGEFVPSVTDARDSGAKAAFSADDIILGGELCGISAATDGIVVTGIGTVKTKSGEKTPARDAGLENGDVIYSVDGVKVDSVNGFTKMITRASGKKNLGVLRNGKKLTLEILPEKDENGTNRAGIYVRDKVAGIGTVTFRSAKDGSLAILGHGISEPRSRRVIPLKNGGLHPVVFSGVNVSRPGTPGEIRGTLGKTKTGYVTDNTETGVYGIMNGTPAPGQKITVAPKQEIKKGKVSIVCTVTNEGKKEYAAEIEEFTDIFSDTKNFIVRITSPELLSLTGGIVQGMSGSPILQNGKLVGAVTHVLVNDPTRGYGIFIENMFCGVNHGDSQNAA